MELVAVSAKEQIGSSRMNAYMNAPIQAHPIKKLVCGANAYNVCEDQEPLRFAGVHCMMANLSEADEGTSRGDLQSFSMLSKPHEE
ncbi:hypothetical protein PGT21_018563 [Puccinia graminis f. sp. tritici]|uniref:Uncharacterized protein n=1 Tax=Puccinia graminis f. sp. tritici TaxID=56615 RepID=A0A5B0NXI3_PUCGR|nr:hypothetical protein PGT21_018563 [Puccinia graminis f. sp. tritici]KAA1093366.1 hypothetical protein PGTUg99_026169 [Puccinia graminis f. sp. tritici]